jgi:Glycosyl transferase family 11
VITYRRLGTNGRLGNQLWQIASTIGIAESRGDRAGFPFWRYRPFFSVPDRYFPDLSELQSDDLGPDFLQDLSNITPIADRVREYFRPPDALDEDLRRRHAALFALSHRTVVHVRRGDYLRHPDHFRWLRMDYFEEAMARCRGPYVVFSDDLPWCREHFPSECHFVERNLNYEDLHLMALLGDEFVISNATFGWWPAWLSGAKTVAPEHWWGPALSWADESLALPADWDLF